MFLPIPGTHSAEGVGKMANLRGCNVKFDAKKMMLAMALTIVSGVANAGWVDVGATDSVTAYVDPSTIKKSGNVATMWDLMDYKKAQEIPAGKSFQSVRAQTEYNCTDRNLRPVTASAHSEKMARGGTVHAVSEPGRWRPVPPGSLDEAFWTIACGKTITKAL
jgi:hypothetical protein